MNSITDESGYTIDLSADTFVSTASNRSGSGLFLLSKAVLILIDDLFLNFGDIIKNSIYMKGVI